MKKTTLLQLLEMVKTNTIKNITPQKMQKSALEYTWLKNEFRCLKETTNEEQRTVHIEAINQFFEKNKELFKYIHAPYKEYYSAMSKIENFITNLTEEEDE